MEDEKEGEMRGRRGERRKRSKRSGERGKRGRRRGERLERTMTKVRQEQRKKQKLTANADLIIVQILTKIIKNSLSIRNTSSSTHLLYEIHEVSSSEGGVKTIYNHADVNLIV